MDLQEFVSVYSSVQRSIELFPDPEASLATSRTKVAILDSGISHARFSTRSHRVLGRSFVWTNPDDVTELEAPWWLAPDPHGSQMANIISQLDPHCEFYIAQIAEDMRYIKESNVIKVCKRKDKPERTQARKESTKAKKLLFQNPGPRMGAERGGPDR
jgi:hypothetical protein